MTDPAVVSAVVVDCRNPHRVAAFWQAVLGDRIVSYPHLGVEALRAPGITFDFVTVEREKTTKNRWHLDLATEDPDLLVGRVLDLGGSLAHDFAESEGFVVMRDPEENEFCILRGAPAHAPWSPPPGTLP